MGKTIEGSKKVACVVCGKPFEPGDRLEGFLRSPEDPQGSWGPTVEVDAQFQARVAINHDKVRRRHAKGNG